MISATRIDKGIEIEDLIKILPESVTYLMDQGIRCLRCGEPLWGSLESAAQEKGFSDEQITVFVNDLNNMKQQSKK